MRRKDSQDWLWNPFPYLLMRITVGEVHDTFPPCFPRWLITFLPYRLLLIWILIYGSFILSRSVKKIIFVSFQPPVLSSTNGRNKRPRFCECTGRTAPRQILPDESHRFPKWMLYSAQLALDTDKVAFHLHIVEMEQRHCQFYPRYAFRS